MTTAPGSVNGALNRTAARVQELEYAVDVAIEAVEGGHLAYAAAVLASARDGSEFPCRTCLQPLGTGTVHLGGGAVGDCPDCVRDAAEEAGCRAGHDV